MILNMKHHIHYFLTWTVFTLYYKVNTARFLQGHNGPNVGLFNDVTTNGKNSKQVDVATHV